MGTTTGGGNVAPVISTAELTPDPAYEQSLLTCSAIGATDGDGDQITFTYAWWVNDAEIAATGQNLEGTDFDKGDSVYCVITPSDASQSGSPATSNTVIIQNTPPTGQSVDINPNPATPVDTLVASPNGWNDPDTGDAEDWQFDWFVNGAAAGSGGASLAGVFFKGDQVYVVATPFDGTDLGDPIQSDTVNIVNTPPELAAADLSPTTPIVTDVLTCSPVNPTDADGDPITFAYEWFVNGTAAGSGTDILAAPQFARDDQVYCVITPNDGTDDGTPVQSNTVTIVNSPPIMNSVDLTPDPATELDVLVCTPNGMTDPDGDPVTLTFGWTVSGLTVSGATGSTLGGADFDKGDPVQCSVTASDGIAFAAPVLSNVVVIGNTPPSVTSGVVTPDPIYTLDTAGVTAYGWNDIDGDAEQYQYQWYKNGLLLVGATGSTLLGPNFVKHDLLSVEITPWDGDDAGAPVVTPLLEVQNSPPTAPSVTVTPLAPDTADTLLCGLSISSSDVDSDTITYGYSWTQNGSPTAYITNTVPGSATTLGETWTCYVTPNDGEEDGVAGSAQVQIQDITAPDPPVLDPIDRYRNETIVDIDGTAEPNTTITLYATCDMGSSGTDVTNADPFGNFSFQWTMLPGETCDFQADSTDSGSNTSGLSNQVTTTVCGTPDPWEAIAGYGDDSLNAVDEWGPIADNGSGTIYLEGNILDQDPADWFVVYTSDNVAADRIAGLDNYDFHALLTAGAPEYTFLVYKGSVGPGNLECPTEINGYDDYNDYVQDTGDAPDHAAASPSNLCGLNSSSLNDCEDFGTAYYIRVLRNAAAPLDCTPYQITITNNAP